MSSDDEVWKLTNELRFNEKRDAAIIRLKQIGAASISILIRCLGHDRSVFPAQQRGAIEALAGIGDEAVLKLVECLNTSSDPWARIKAAKALNIQGKGYLAVPVLTMLLQGAPDIGRFAAMSLGDIGEAARPAIPDLTLMMKNHLFNCSRVEAAAALARLGESQKAIPVLLGFLRDNEWEVRFSAWCGLRDVANLVISHSKKLVKLAEAEENPWVKRETEGVISKIKQLLMEN